MAKDYCSKCKKFREKPGRYSDEYGNVICYLCKTILIEKGIEEFKIELINNRLKKEECERVINSSKDSNLPIKKLNEMLKNIRNSSSIRGKEQASQYREIVNLIKKKKDYSDLKNDEEEIKYNIETLLKKQTEKNIK